MKNSTSELTLAEGRVYTAPVILFLSATFILTLARAMALPYLVVYCAERFGLGVADVGLALGGALMASSLFSLYGGFLVDRFSNYQILLAAGGLFALAFGTAFHTDSLVAFFTAIVVVNLAYAVIDIAVKSGIGTLVVAQKRVAVFSVKYTLTNIGFAVGPFLGVLLAQVSPGLPFAVAGLVGALFVAIYGLLGEKTSAIVASPSQHNGFLAVLGYLVRDYRLVCFTLGGLLSAIIFGQFSAYLSQYLLVTSSPERTYQIINYLVTTNACVVIGLQYLVGSRINQANLFRMLCLGMLFFLVGLIGFSQADGVPMWVIAMVVFTIGEIIIIPTEYMFIDFIAPGNLRGVYYGAQNLSNLGAALGPVLCGAALSLYQPQAMFYLLSLCVVLALGFYYMGYKSKVGVHDSL
ncbi:MFS transporter [Pseudomonas sp. R5(2019)]|uniref:MFS transporter n=1 Tax=Pseudomonas sp. R5(2019) TaxID=2697566 RepID=UPI0014134BC8|nr:MFS transporter [Pseudomonas sp. R5(2019)]NBA98033.1 MFS transporter [Pseudomonas sp. R5(2019)]